MRTERVNELKASMKSFGKDAYQKSELLDEMFALQQEIVSLTFNQDHAGTIAAGFTSSVGSLLQKGNKGIGG